MNSDNNQPNAKPSFEIVGLHGETNGRCCVQHNGCGKYLEAGDVCRIVPTQVQIQDKVEEALKVVKIEDGTECCVVGFVPKAYLKHKEVLKAVNQMVQVIELYEDSTNTAKRRASKRNQGMASVLPLSQVPFNG
jgi:hypothetical protein